MDLSSSAAMSLRRLRQNRFVRELSREFRVHPEQLIQPLFVVEGLSKPKPVPALTGVHQETRESLLRQIESDLEAGVSKFLLFGVPLKPDLHQVQWTGEFLAGAIHDIRKTFGRDLFLAVDVCLCSLTDHGHCGILNETHTSVENAASVAELARLAVVYAHAGADCVAPSDMMDGRVAAIRAALDQAGDCETLIMSYSAKFHSKFYGPFRLAANSAPRGHTPLRDRATYQLDAGRWSDALLSSERDVREGADILMVKPGLPYLDVLYRLSQAIPRPWAVYQVSGEYAAIELLGREGLIDAGAAHAEAWLAMVRAGASMIITYGARLGAHRVLSHEPVHPA